MEKRLLKVLLKRENFLRTSSFVKVGILPKELDELLKTIQYAHERFNNDELSVAELHDLHLSRNPALTFAAKNNLEILLQEIDNEQTISPDIADEIIQAAYKREIARQAGQTAVNILNGREGSFDDIRRILDGYNAPVKARQEAVPEDLDALLDLSVENTKWRFNIETFAREVAGIGPGSFTIIAARPEAGKTAAWVSLCAAPNGFCEQGALVNAICNEEPASRTMLRIWSSRTGLTMEELIQFKVKARELYTPIKGRLQLYDRVGITIDELYSFVAENKPDILVVDQLDKVKIDGKFNGIHEEHRARYTAAREIAKTFNIGLIGISQLSADAQDKAYVDFSMLENSKTGKAAEADLIICIGANKTTHGDECRILNLSKNKISGSHASIVVRLDSRTSRYEV
jgi:hypothetical protein